MNHFVTLIYHSILICTRTVDTSSSSSCLSLKRPGRSLSPFSLVLRRSISTQNCKSAWQPKEFLSRQIWPLLSHPSTCVSPSPPWQWRCQLHWHKCKRLSSVVSRLAWRSTQNLEDTATQLTASEEKMATSWLIWSTGTVWLLTIQHILQQLAQRVDLEILHNLFMLKASVLSVMEHARGKVIVASPFLQYLIFLVLVLEGMSCTVVMVTHLILGVLHLMLWSKRKSFLPTEVL